MSEPLLRLEVGAVAAGGFCVARHEGRVVFVRHALPGEVVMARLDPASSGPRAAGKRFWRADAVEVLEPSPDRVVPPCPAARPGGCGGCDWQHASLAAQRLSKAAVIRDQFSRLAGIELPDLVVEPPGGPSNGTEPDDGLGWRTRVRFAVDARGRAGFRSARSHAVIPVAGCPIAHPGVAAADIPGRSWPGAAAVEVVDGSPGPALVIVEESSGPPPSGRRGARSESPPREPVRRVEGRRTWVEHHVSTPLLPEPRRFRVSDGGFWQVHPAAPATLVDAVLGVTMPAAGERAVDLYAGVGLFAAALALRVGPAGFVHAVESEGRACKDARRNLHDLPQVRITQGLVEASPDPDDPDHTADTADASHWSSGRADVVVLDPPRAGAGPEVMARIAALRPRVVAYVSCDAASLARDITHAAQNGYRLTGLRAFDMFPMTHHVECLATLHPNEIV